MKIAKTGKLNGYDKRDGVDASRELKYYRAVKRNGEVPNLSAKPALQKMSFKKERQAKHYGACL